MTSSKNTLKENKKLYELLDALKLNAVPENIDKIVELATRHQWDYPHFLEQLCEIEVTQREERSTQRRLRAARFPVVKTLDNFDWNWPRKINRLQIQNLFRLSFIEQKANVIVLGGVGLGKTHISTALAYQACLKGFNVLHASAIDIINTLSAAATAGRLKQELKRFTKPDILLMDELGYLPIDKMGADLLFQVISQRYEVGPIILTTNKPFKKWAEIFNNDSTLTSAVLDRLLHHAETVVIEGKSYRMKDQSVEPLL